MPTTPATSHIGRLLGGLLLAGSLAACDGGAASSGSSAGPSRTGLQASATAPASAAASSAAAPGSSLPNVGPQGQLTVPLKIVQSPSGSTLALVPVSINGQGPYAFALDTGASNSTVDEQLAKKLQLPNEGSAGQITGVAAVTQAQLLKVQNWRVGDIKLQPANVISVQLGGPNAQAGLAGLLGSDVLSQYGAVTIDYDKQFLVLRAKVPASVQAAASVAPAK